MNGLPTLNTRSLKGLSRHLLAGVFVATLMSGPSAFAQSAIPLPPADVPGGAMVQMAQSSADLAQQSMRIDALENSMREMTGKIDELSYNMRQLQEMLQRMQEDNEFRFKELEGGAPKKRSAAEPVAPMPEEPAVAAAEPEPQFITNNDAALAGSSDGSDTSVDLSQGFSIEPGVEPGGDTGNAGVLPQVLGTLPADAGTGKSLGSGPLDLSAMARGETQTATLDNGDPDAIGDVLAGAAPPPRSALPNLDLEAPSVSTQVADSVAPTDPRDAYNQAYNYIVSGEYAEAEARFKQFLNDFPGNKLAANATYWLGESFYARKQFRDAADSFLTTYRDYPRSQKAPDSLLKLGLSLEGLGQKEAACATYGELERKYPSASPALLAQLADNKSNAGC